MASTPGCASKRNIAAQVTPYGEMGVVANFACQRPHDNKAFQWFLGGSVLAYLPLAGDAVSIVWSAPDNEARTLMDMTPEALGEHVAAASRHRLGALHMLTPAAAFPLRLMRVARGIGRRVALIGDAAHAIHPLSGDGIISAIVMPRFSLGHCATFLTTAISVWQPNRAIRARPC